MPSCIDTLLAVTLVPTVASSSCFRKSSSTASMRSRRGSRRSSCRKRRRALDERGSFAIALPGGSVARAFFPRLARLPLDWSRIAFFWGDERAVPATRSGVELRRGTRALARSPRRCPTRASTACEPTPPTSTDRQRTTRTTWCACWARRRGSTWRSWASGPDGHVCSLFPGHALLREERRWVASIEDAPKPPARRLTLTLPALEAAELVVVAAFGSGKAAAVRAALHDPESELPVALATRRARRVLFLLDPQAAAAC